VLDRRLATLERAAQVDRGEQPGRHLDEAEERAVAFRIPGGAERLHARGGRHGAETAAEVEAHVRLGLLAPPESTRPGVRAQEQREREGRQEEAGDGEGEAAGGAQGIHRATLRRARQRGDRSCDQCLIASRRPPTEDPPFTPDWDRALRRCFEQARRYRLADADADDVAQESAARAWRKLSSLKDPASFDGWLAAICRNEALRRLERRVDLFELYERAGPAADDPSPELAAAIDLRRALMELPPRDRLLLWLRFVEDLTYRDIGALMGLSEVAVRIRVHRLRRRLGEH
jgi:RNA polymerase sigma-70 factor (ECF subfamily)